MRKKIATWSIVLISLIGCRTITANFPRDVSSIELENGVKITLELNEDLMAMRDPIVTKKLTIDYGKRQVVYRTTDDYYNFDLLLTSRDHDTLWQVLYDGWHVSAECSFSDEDARFKERYVKLPEDTIQDTLMWIKYEDFAFEVE